VEKLTINEPSQLPSSGYRPNRSRPASLIPSSEHSYNISLTGELELNNFPNLKQLTIYQTQLIKLKLVQIPKLEKVNFRIPG
jgi:hypothetical protein